MRLKRFSLLLISSVLFIWAVSFFGGPVIIKNIVKLYFGNEIVLHSVRVSPTLDIYVGRVEFRALQLNSTKKLSGFARQIEFDWSLISGKAILSVKASAINLDDKLISNKSVIEIYRGSFWDFNTFNFIADGKSVEYFGIGHIEHIKIKFNLNRQELAVSEIFTKLKNIKVTGGREVFVKDASIQLDSFDLSADIRHQSNTIEIMANDLKTTTYNLTASEIYSKIENHRGELSTAIFWNDVSAYDGRFLSDTFIIQAQTNNLKMPVNVSMFAGAPITVTFANVSYDNFKASDFEIEALLKSEQSPLLLDVDVRAKDLTLGSADFYVGEFASTSMANLISLDINPQGAGFEITLNGIAGIDQPKRLNTKIVSKMVSEDKLLNCFINKCTVKDGFLDYVFVANDAFLKGSVKCSSPTCDISSVSHSIQTDDTNKFFSNLIETKLFNPILIFYIQSNIMSGQKNGSGHKKIFQ